MRRSVRRALAVVVVSALTAFAPTAGYGQTLASITGVVKDASGAILPGVTVEASSPALIEKVRSVVTDGTGQYRIEALRPGLYSVTFTLAGFSGVRRVGIELTGSFSASVNAELSVGALEETITVSGESPVVDVQNTMVQRVIDRDIIDLIPAGRDIYNMAAATIPGVINNFRDVGGVNLTRTTTPGSVSIHGSVGNTDQQLFQNGVPMMSAAFASYGFGGQNNNAGTQEITIDTDNLSAEASNGGIRINIVPRDGGNRRSGIVYARFTNGSLQGDNFTEDLRARGLGTPNGIKENWEVNPGFGGAIKQDRLWFYASARYTKDFGYVAGMFDNTNANNPSAWTYEPDPTKPAVVGSTSPEGKLRLTLQARPKHKLGLTWSEQKDSTCPTEITATTAPEAGTCRPQPVIRIGQGDWTSPVTNRLLLEVGFLFNRLQSNQLPVDGHNPAMISVVEQSTGLRYRSAEQWRRQPHASKNVRGAVSYITGAHAAKFGATHRSGSVDFYAFDFQPLSYRFNNGIPNQLTERALPSRYQGNIDHDIGLFAQDKWTRDRLTLTYGIRYDYFGLSYPEYRIGPTALAPNRTFTFPRQDAIAWKDITPRLGVAYDLFGNGKTAIKATANKYLINGGGGTGGGNTSIYSGAHPANSLVLSTTRTWNDANRDYVPNCDLTIPGANGECGAMANANFGTLVIGRTYADDVMKGWGARGFNWEFSAGVQHELVPRVALNVGYFRRIFGNEPVTDPNPNTGPSDYDTFSITAPVDPRLPGGGGYVISGLYDIKPAKFGLPATALVTSPDNYGRQINHWNGVDVTVNARPRDGMLLQGGLSTGRTSKDNCEVVAKIENPSPLYCHTDTKFETQLKLNGTYTVPRADVLIGIVFQSLQGPQIVATYNAPNALVAPSLGRSLSGGAANVAVNLIEPGSLYGDRMYQTDVRVGKILRLAGTRTMFNVDVFNAFNASPVVTENPSYGAFRRPTGTLLARFVRLSAQFDF